MTLVIPKILGKYQERHLRNSIIDEYGMRWVRCPGAVIRGTRLTEIHSVPLYKMMGWQLDDKSTTCFDCQRVKTRHVVAGAVAQKQIIFSRAGGCQWVEDGIRCIMRYPEHLHGNFALDHIDPKLKRKHDLWSSWIFWNVEEFWTRVVPNLQVLCQHHNGVKFGKEYGVGGIMHVEPWLEQYDYELIPPDENQLTLFGPNELT